MKFIAEIDVMPLKALLNPQGKAVHHGLQNMGIIEIESVRIGKHMTLELDAATKEIAVEKVEEACKKLLANQIMESFTYQIIERENQS